MNRMLFVFCLILYFSVNVFAQKQTEEDSLKQALAVANEDTNKVLILKRLGRIHLFSRPDTAKLLFDQGIKLATELGFTLGRSDIARNVGIHHAVLGNYDSAIYWIMESIHLIRPSGDSLGVAMSYNNLGNIYRMQGNFKRAMECYLHAQRLYDLANEPKSQMGALNNLGILADLMGDQEKAMEYYLAHLKLAKENNNLGSMSSAFINIGVLFFREEKYDTALVYYHKAAKIEQQLGDKYGLSQAILNIGHVHHARGNYPEALENYENSLDLSEEIGDQFDIANTLCSMGTTYTMEKKYKVALTYLHRALKVAQDVNAKEYIRDSYAGLAKAYEGSGDYQQAFNYQELYTQIKDSILNKENFKQIKELESKYDNEKKAGEIAVLTKESELQEEIISNQATLRNILILGFALVIVFSAFLIRGYRKRLRVNRLLAEKNQEISDQKIRELQKTQKLQAMQGMVEGQEAERIRVAKDLHDSLGGLLSSVKMQFSQLNPNQTAASSEYQKVDLLIDEACTELRKVAHNMMPDALMKFGLVTAVEDLAGKIENQAKLQIDVQAIGLNYRLDNKKEIAIYRVIQELLNNIVKHAQASEILVQLVLHEDRLNLIVEDNGVGFDLDQASQADGMGLKNVRSRISYLNGNISFDSVVDTGTTVTIDIPI
ncbi:MAG: sensor histidine kinase [Bacteroidetes bacterium]|nr:sensor histidine kinase [Bacteroidota bacterium]